MDVFNDIHSKNFWNNDESVSGAGSTMAATEIIREEIPKLVKQYGITSILDIPCGDFNWQDRMAREMNIEMDVAYYTADIVPELIHENRGKYQGKEFTILDITKDILPKVDMILCRDLLGHFSNRDVRRALENIRRNKPTYLLATTFPDHENLHDITTGQWRPINLASFFGLPDPIEIINEGVVGEFGDKSLGLWRLR